MAVEIPVVIDIDKAFAEAAKRVPQAIAPMQKAVDEKTLEVVVEINKKGDVAEVLDFVGKSKKSMSELQYAIKSVKQQLDELYQKKGGNVDLTQGEGKALSEALIILEDIVAQRQSLSRTIEKNALDVQREIEAERQHQAAINMVTKSIDDLNVKLAAWRQDLNSADTSSSAFVKAAQNAGLLERALERVNSQARIIGMNTGSIDQLNAKLQEINRKFNAMPADAREQLGASLLADYKAISKELEKEGRTLPQIIAEESRLEQLRQKGIQSRRYENAILNTTVKTTRILQEQERILSDRLSRAVIGSSKYDQLRTQLEGVRKEMEKAKGSADTLATSLNRQSSVVGQLAGQFASYISIYSLLRFAKQIRDVTGELEYQRVALGHLIQDEEYGAELFERIKAAAIESPFRIKDLVTYTKQLAAFRIEQEELFDTMHRLADVSAGLGVDMDRLILAYGQVRAAAVLRGQELRQFTEAGIPLVDLLAEKFSELNGRAVKTAEVFDLISKRAVPFSMISEIFEDLTEKGGMFYKMQERQAATLTGRWEKLKDAFDIGLQTVGNTKTFQVYNDVILGALNLVAKNLRLLPKLIEGASAAWILYYAATTRARIATRRAAMAEIEEATAKEAQSIANIRGIKNVEAYTYALLRQKTATNALARGFWKLWAAVVASPVGAAVAAIGAIAAALFLFRKRADEAQNSFHEFDEFIEDTSKGLKDTARYDKLIDRYERLAEKTDLTDKEHQRLYQTMSLLQEQFPGVTVGIDNETEAIDEQLRKLRELNDEREREVRERGEAELGAKRAELTDAEKKRDKMYRDRLKQQQDAAILERKLAIMDDQYKDSKVWRNAQKSIGEINRELSEQDKLIEGLQKRIVSLNRILHPEENPFTGWKKKIQEMRDITVGEVTSPIFTDDEIEKWETLDKALADIDKRKKEVAQREDELSKAIKNQTGEIKEQIQSELEWARAERLRLEAMQDFFKTPTVFAKDIMDNFSNLLLKTYDEGNLKKFGKGLLGLLSMQTNIAFNTDLLSRPLIDAAELVKKGWQDAGEGIATVFSSVYDWTDEYGNKHNILVTPILPDGSVLSPEELDDYVKNVLLASDLKNDEKKLLLGVDVSEDASEKLHEMQEEYYSLVKLSEHLPEQFLITDDELSKLKTATDVLNLLNEKISSVEKELDKVEQVKLAPNISDEAIQAAAKYSENLQEVYNWLLALRGRYTDPLSDIAKDVQSGYEDIIEATYKGKDKESYAKTGLFSNEDLEKIKNVIDLYSVWSQKLKAVNSEISHYNKQLSASLSDDQRQKILDTIATLDVEKKALERLGGDYGFVLNTKDPGGDQQDPWILIFKNRAKFMQDFRAGVEDLNKYMSESISLGKIQDTMKGRGASLGIDVSELNGSRQEMLAWYDKTIQEITEKIQKLGGKTWAGLGVQAILAKDTKSRTLKAWQDLLADIFKERTDFDLSQQKKDLEDAFKRMKDELNQSETIKKFYDDILSVTGDSGLATTLTVSVYGNIDQDFKKRMQSLLNKAFASLSADAKTPEMKAAIDSQDFGYILDNLSQFSKEWQDKLKDMAKESQNYSADIMKNFANLVAKYGSTAQKIATIKAKAENEVKKVEEALAKSLTDPSLTPEQKKALQDRAAEIIKAINAGMDLDVFKQSDEYIKFFSEINVMTAKQAATVRGELRKADLKAFREGAISADELRKKLRAIDEQFRKLTESSTLFGAYLSGGIDAANKKLQEYADTVQALAEKMKSGKGLNSQEQSYASKMLKLFGSEGTKGAKTYEQLIAAFSNNGGIEKAGEAFGKMGEGMSAMAANGAGVIAIVDAIIKAVNSTIVGIQQIIDQLNEVRAEDKKIGGWFRYLGDFNKYAYSGWEKLKSGDPIGAVTDVASSIISVFNNIKRGKVDKLNKKIEKQDDILHNLEKDYEALDKAIQKAFGSDYISTYNQQMKVMEAEAAAYREQARLERKKGKSADEKKAKGYEEEAEKLEQQMAEKRSQISEFMTDTDVTSAAKSFAKSWIDAYKQFAFTSGAIKENFKEMIDSMVVNSLAARLIQDILKDVFKDIDDLAQEGGELSEQDIAKIAAETEVATGKIDTAMQALMQRLAAAGINMRATGSDLSGISKDIAGASEESINGLAAGINTQNFYMSYMPAISATVDAILAAIGGSTGENTAAGRAMARAASADNQTGQTFGDETFRGQMQRIDENISEIRYMLKSVITPKSANTNTHAVATK